MPDNNLPKEFQDKIRGFLKDYPIARIDKNLKLVFIGYLRDQREGLPAEFDQVLDDVEALFMLVEIMRSERLS